MNLSEPTVGVLPDETLSEIRDNIFLALDATESPGMTERNRTEARAALAEALDLLEGGAA